MLRKTNQNQKSEPIQNFFASFLTPQNFTSDTNITSSLPSTSPVLQQLQIDATKCSPETVKELNYLIHQVLKYPQATQSETHSRANRLGLTDIVEKDSTVHPQPTLQTQSSELKPQYCSDCGLIVQKQTIPFCTSFKQFPNAGIGIYLLFQSFKNIGILILILGVVFSGYSLHLNISEPSESLTLDNLPTKLSYGSVILYFESNTDIEFSVLVEAWLVVGVVVAWVLVLSYMNVQDIKIEQMIDLKTITASDFTVMIENIPYSLTQQQLQVQFDRYYQKLVSQNHINSENSEHKTDLKQFKIKKICKGIPFYLVQNEKQVQKIEEIDEQLTQYRQKFTSWVEEVQAHHNFKSTKKQERDAEYEKYLQLKRQKDQIQGSKYTRFQNRSNNLDIKQTVFFVTFAKSQSANIICDFNPQAISEKLRDFIGCCSTVVYFKLQSHKQNQNVRLCRAPEPEDIIWQNIGMQFKSIVRRKCLTFFVTLLLLGVSFGSVYGLTLLELEQDSAVLLYGTSVVITVINEIIGTAIYNLTTYEKNMTKTSQQISLAIKTVLAQIINSILIPVIVDVYYLKNIYFANGLVTDVYYMAITNAILPPVLTLVNSTYLISRIKAWYKKRPYPRLVLQQQTLNEYCQLPEYQLGYAYIYYIDCFFFTCFYVTMQPFIVIFSLAGVILMYWIQKHRLLQRSSRPIPSTSLLADAMWQLIFFGPFILSIGHIVWFNLVTDNGFVISKFIYIPQVASITISVVFFCLPMDSILHAYFASRDEEILDYDECVSKLKSDYDRSNPTTKEEGLSVFMKFVEKAFGKMNNNQDKGKGFFTQKQNDSKISLRNVNLTEEEILHNNDKNVSFTENKQERNHNIFMQLEEEQEEGQGNLPINIFASMFGAKPRRRPKQFKQAQMNPDVSNNVGPTLESNNSPKLVANTVKKKKVVKSPYNAHLS